MNTDNTNEVENFMEKLEQMIQNAPQGVNLFLVGKGNKINKFIVIGDLMEIGASMVGSLVRSPEPHFGIITKLISTSIEVATDKKIKTPIPPSNI